MSMQHLKEALSDRGDPDLAKRVARVQNDFVKRHPGEKDIPLPESVVRSAGLATTRPTSVFQAESTEGQKGPEATLLRVRQEHTRRLHTAEFTPEFVQESWQTMWGAWIAIAKRNDPKLDIPVPQVPDCGRTQAQLEALAQNEQGRVYVAPMSYKMLARVFPGMQSNNAAQDRIRDDIPVEGWYDFDISIAAPYLGITEISLREEAVDGWEVGAAKTYIAATQGSKVLVDRYLDQEGESIATWTESLLPNSRVGGKVVHGYSCSDPSGGVDFIPSYEPDVPNRYRGGRLQKK